jgi:hypothetical protein
LVRAEDFIAKAGEDHLFNRVVFTDAGTHYVSPRTVTAKATLNF